MQPQAVIALCTTLLALAGCDGSSRDVDRIINALTGKVDQQSQDLAATRVHTDAELAELRKTYSALALGIANKATQPVTEAVVVVAETQVPEPVIEPPEPVIEPIVALNEHQVWQTDPGYVCSPEFRRKSCTDWGEPVWLDGSMNWLPFGEIP